MCKTGTVTWANSAGANQNAASHKGLHGLCKLQKVKS